GCPVRHSAARSGGWPCHRPATAGTDAGKTAGTGGRISYQGGGRKIAWVLREPTGDAASGTGHNPYARMIEIRFIGSGPRSLSALRGAPRGWLHDITENPRTKNPRTKNPRTKNPRTKNPRTKNLGDTLRADHRRWLQA